MSNYVPLSSRDGKDSRDYEVLHEGAPPWLRDKLIAFVQDSLGYYDRFRDWVWLEGALGSLELALQVSLSGTQPKGRALLQRCSSDDWLLLNTVDWLLHEGRFDVDVANLKDVLDRGRSVWEVVEDGERHRLSRRVNEALTNTVRTSLQIPTSASDHLRKAWEQAWGVQPNATEAYLEAVKATEAALKPIVSPSNNGTTLGTLIRDIRSSPSAFRIRLNPRRGLDSIETFVGELELLWQSQHRHGESVTTANTVEEAQDAVSLAATIVDWIQRGAFSRI